MINLDDTPTIIDKQGGDKVIKSISALQKQLQQSFTESQQVVFPEAYRNVKNVVVCGMGGSRFPSLILNHLFKTKLQVPYTVNDEYEIPGYVGKDTLVILSSYSGTTEEVIAAGKQAHAQGALLTGVTNGGEVKSFLESINAPAYYFDTKYNPSTQPRIGFGYLVGGHLGLLMKLGLVQEDPHEVDSALAKMDEITKSFGMETPITENPAKQLAQFLQEKYPYYIVSEFLTGVGNALGNQTNETAKSISSFRVIPELNHHLMEGLKFPVAHREMGTFVFFYSQLYSAPIQKRFHITKEVVEQNKMSTYWHELKGQTKIEQVFELMSLGSYVSMYLAALYEQDPAAIPFVDYFKKRLKEL